MKQIKFLKNHLVFIIALCLVLIKCESFVSPQNSNKILTVTTHQPKILMNNSSTVSYKNLTVTIVPVTNLTETTAKITRFQQINVLEATVTLIPTDNKTVLSDSKNISDMIKLDECYRRLKDDMKYFNSFQLDKILAFFVLICGNLMVLCVFVITSQMVKNYKRSSSVYERLRLDEIY